MCPAGSEAVGESTSPGEKKPSSGDYKISHLAGGGEQEAVGFCVSPPDISEILQHVLHGDAVSRKTRLRVRWKSTSFRCTPEKCAWERVSPACSVILLSWQTGSSRKSHKDCHRSPSESAFQ